MHTDRGLLCWHKLLVKTQRPNRTDYTGLVWADGMCHITYTNTRLPSEAQRRRHGHFVAPCDGIVAPAARAGRRDQKIGASQTGALPEGFPQTTPLDDHLQTCPCEAPAINPVPADRSCRDLETRDACKVSYNKRKEDPPPPLICNWHQAKGCIPWSCFPTPGDKSCWSVCTDKCMPIKTCSIENNLECMCHWDEAVMNDPHCEGASPPPPAHTTTSSTTPQPTTTTPVPETTTPPFCDCTSLEQRASDLEELLKLLNRQVNVWMRSERKACAVTLAD